MAICLEYQAVYADRRSVKVSLRSQILAAMVLLAALGTKVWLKLEITDLGYQIAQEREQTVTLDMERRELELQHSVLMRPDRLAGSAKVRLGLKTLNPAQARRVTS